MNIRTHILRLTGLSALFVPVIAAAQNRKLNVGVGTSYTFLEIVTRIITYLTGTIGIIALAMFVVGAFMITLSGVKEDYRQRGKDLMIGAVLSMAVVTGAYAVLRTVDYFLS